MSTPPRYDGPFRLPVHGTVFGRRAEVVRRLREGDRLILVPDPPGVKQPAVWVHAEGGDVIGHLPTPIGLWLAPWMLSGGRCRATVARVAGEEVASWERLVVEVTCVAGEEPD